VDEKAVMMGERERVAGEAGRVRGPAASRKKAHAHCGERWWAYGSVFATPSDPSGLRMA